MQKMKPLFIHLFIYFLFICLFICLFMCLFIYVFIYLFLYGSLSCPRTADESKKGLLFLVQLLSTSNSEQPKNQWARGIYSPFCMFVLLVFI